MSKGAQNGPVRPPSRPPHQGARCLDNERHVFLPGEKLCLCKSEQAVA